MKTAMCTVMCLFFAVVSTQHCQAQDELIEKMVRPGTSPDLYVPAVRVGKTVYISGTGDGRPEDPNESYREKTRRCLGSIERSLEMAGLGLENVVQAWVMLEDLERFGEMNEVWKELFPENPPARTAIGVANIPGPSQVEITVIAYSDLSERTCYRPHETPYSLTVRAGETVYVAGRGSAGPDGVQPPSFKAQVRQAMENMRAALDEADVTFENVVWSNIYIDNYDNFGIVNKVYSEYFDYGNEPARVNVFVEGIPGDNHVEVTCIATTDLSSREVVRPASLSYGPVGMAPTASPGVWAGETLYLSGQGGFDPVGGMTTTDLDVQTRRMMRTQLDVLEAAGLDFGDVVSGNIYLRNINDYGAFNQLYRDYFIIGGPGVRTCFQPNHGSEKNDIRVRCSFIAAGRRSGR